MHSLWTHCALTVVGTLARGGGIQPRAVDALLQLFSRSHKAIPAQPDLLTTDLVGLVWPGSWTPLFEQGGPGGTLAGGWEGGL